VFERLGRASTRHGRTIAGLYLALSLGFAWRGASIHFETSIAELLPRGTPSADDLRDLLLAEGTLDRLLIAVSRDPGAADPEDEALALEDAAEALSERLRRTGLFRDVRYGVGEDDLLALARFAMAHLPVLVDPDRVPALAARLEPAGVRAAALELRRRGTDPGFLGTLETLASLDPLNLLPLALPPDEAAPGGFRPDPRTGLFLSRDGRRLLLVTEPRHPPTEIDFSRRLLEAVRDVEAGVARDLPDGGRLRFDHAGGHLFALEDETRVRRDATLTCLISVLGIACVYLFVIRRIALWIAVLVPLTMTTVWTLGLASIYPGRLNMVTVAFAAILLGIGDDAMIHMYLREREERRSGTPAPASAVAALRATGPAVTVATLTTAAAFLSLSSVRFRGLAELGVIAAFGMLNLLVGVLVFFPAALTLLARRPGPEDGLALRLPLRALLALHRWAAPRRRAVLGAAGLLTAAMLAPALTTRVSADLRSIRGDDPAAEALRRVLAPFEGAAAETMVVIHGARDAPPDAIRVERGLEAAAALQAFCREGRAAGLLAACDNPSARFPPESVQRARFRAAGGLPWERAAEILTAEASALGLRPSFLAPFLEAARSYGDYDTVRIVPDPAAFGPLGVPVTRVHFPDPGAAGTLAGEVRRRLEPFPTRVAAVALVSSDLGRVIADDFRRAAIIVAITTLALVLMAFRKVGRALLVLAPLAVGLVWMAGMARLAGVDFNLMSLMAMPIVFGLGVDYGVYVVDRWERSGRDAESALAGTGPAVLVTGLTTLVGFGALLAARLAGLRTLGFAVVTGTGFTLAAALVLLPLLLPRRRPALTAPPDTLV
jgi:predicted RND superfamily exporter protein